MDRSTIPEPVTAVTELASAWLPQRMTVVESRLRELVESNGGELSGDAAGTLAAGGKRMRPLLVLLCAGPGSGADAIRAATAVELVHMATLVHDDVLDAAPLRRGRPTVFATSGRERAIALGDLLLSLAFCEIAVPGGEGQVTSLSRASVALARGELMQRQDAFDLEIGEDRYLGRCVLKTASLFECACTIGSAGLSDHDPNGPLAAFGREIGLAFQLLDDVLDVTGPPERTGKARGTDLLDGTVTMPLIVAIDRDPALADLDLHGLDAAAAVAVCERIVATGATDQVREAARARVEAAKAALAGTELGAERVTQLRLVADGVVERYS